MFKIYVGNLDYKVKVEQLRELFSVYAPIEDLVIPTDPKTNRAKGFAIVMIRDPELGQAAVKAMQGKRLMGRLLVVNEAVKKKKSGQPVLSKADLLRNGPFGPRMYRMGDPRGRTSRNPRRGHLGTGAPGTAGASPTPTSGPSVTPSLGSTVPSAPGPTSASSSAVGGGSSALSGKPPAAGTPIRPSTSNAPAPAPRGAPSARPIGASPTQRPPIPAGSPPKPASPAAPPPVLARPKAQRLATPKRAAAPEAPKPDQS